MPIALYFPVILFLNTPLQASETEKQTPPDIVLILTDNHGSWTLVCHGNRDIKTPHIDRWAKDGIRFTHAFACNAECSSTRASLLTGLMPSGHGVLSVGAEMDGQRQRPRILRARKNQYTNVAIINGSLC